MAAKKPKGWVKEPVRHSLARKGIKTSVGAKGAQARALHLTEAQGKKVRRLQLEYGMPLDDAIMKATQFRDVSTMLAEHYKSMSDEEVEALWGYYSDVVIGLAKMKGEMPKLIEDRMEGMSSRQLMNVFQQIADEGQRRRNRRGD